MRKSIFFLLIIPLLAEVFLWNASAFASLFYREINLGEPVWDGSVSYYEEYDAVLIGGDGLRLTYSGLDAKIKNLHLDVIPLPEISSANQSTLSHHIAISDQGNQYLYDMPPGLIVSGIPASEYVRLHPYGKVNGLEISFITAGALMVRHINIRANVREPFDFSLFRIALTYALLITAWLLLSGWAFRHPCADIKKAPPSGEAGGEAVSQASPAAAYIQLAISAVVLTALILFFHRIAALNPAYVEMPGEHHRQYWQLTERLLAGEVRLAEEPAAVLVEAANPYDFMWRMAEGVPHLMDYAYYEGGYYVYFGIAPALILYLPHFLIHGEHMPNHIALFWVFAVFAVMLFVLLREIIRQFFPKTPYLVYLLLALMATIVGGHMTLIVEPDLYKVPIAAALMFTVSGLTFWLKALPMEKRRWLFLALGSLCMAAVAACRPQMLLYSALAIPIFYEMTVKKRALFSRRQIGATLAFCLPYLLVAALVMYYNYIRFASPFEFGAAYSLSTNDMTNRPTGIPLSLYGIYYYLLQIPHISPVFPFVERIYFSYLEIGFMGRMTGEYVYGGLLVSNALLWFIGFSKGTSAQLKGKRLWAVVWTAITITGVILIADANMAGILQRYISDFTFGAAFAAVLVALAYGEYCMEKGNNDVFAKVLVLFFLLQITYSCLLIFGSGSHVYGLDEHAPQTFYRFAAWF